MQKPNIRDALTGASLLLLGLFVFQRSLAYGWGTWSEMGAGFFPLMMSVALVLIGFGIIFSSIKKAQNTKKISWRPLIGVSLSIAFFAATFKYIGYIPAVIGSALIGSLTDTETKIGQAIIFSILLSLVGWLIFIFGLGLSISSF